MNWLLFPKFKSHSTETWQLHVELSTIIIYFILAFSVSAYISWLVVKRVNYSNKCFNIFIGTASFYCCLGLLTCITGLILTIMHNLGKL